MAGQPTLYVQFNVPTEARKDLKRLALDISERIVPGGEFSYTEMCAAAAMYLLSIASDPDEVERIVNAGREHEHVYGPKGEPKPSPVINTPPRVWEEKPIPEPLDGGAKGLDGDRPAGRKVSKPPRGKRGPRRK